MQDQNPKTQNTVPNMPAPQGAGQPMVAGTVGVPTAQVAPAQPMQSAQPTQPIKSQQLAQVQTPAKQAQAQAQQAAQAASRATTRAQQGDFVRRIVDKIRGSENILVALSRDPSVDEMAAAIGLTLFLDGLQKHTTAIYSGETPDALAFLQPEGTFETNTDSLRDFIIALSKDKADHLRYKLDGDFVKVYITPYKTTLNEGDLEFSYGDFNVNLVLGLGIPSAGDLDEALSEYGRIMHDATTVDITVDVPGRFAEIEWSDPAASSVSEMVTKLIFAMQGQDTILDKDVATALLTGIVAATGRFSNDKTNSDTMQLASKLMSMGADQQLISANVMDNDGNKPGDVSNETTAEANVYAAQDYAMTAPVPEEAVVTDEVADLPQMTTANTIVEPVIPDLLKKKEIDQAAMQAAAAAAVSEAVASATASAAAAGATGVGVPQVGTQPVGSQASATPVAPAASMMQPVQPTQGVERKDYGQMMEQALAETGGVGALGQPVSSQAMQTASGGEVSGAADATGQSAPAQAAEPVAKSGVVLPPPPEPMAMPTLPNVQVPVAATEAGQDGAFKIPGA